jgi:hypothetical protein
MLPAIAMYLLANITPVFLNQLYESAIKLLQTDVIETGIGVFERDRTRGVDFKVKGLNYHNMEVFELKKLS